MLGSIILGSATTGGISNLVYLIVPVIVVIAIVSSVLRKRRNAAALENGEDMRRLKEAVARVMPAGIDNYQVVFAHWEDVHYSGRRTTTYYYSYALAFDDTRLFVIPLKFQKDEIQPGKPALFTTEYLGVTEIATTMKKGELDRITITLKDKEGKSPLNMYVDVMNTQTDRFHHFNIAQKEECDQFHRFITAISEKVTAENKDLQDRMKNDELAKNIKSSRTLGILALLTCVIPIIGLIFSGAGLFTAPKPSQTGKPVAGFILNAIALAVNIVVTVVMIVSIALL